MDLIAHPTQLDFCASNALYRGFCGGRGAGKSWIGAFDLMRRAKPGRLYMAAAPTYPLMRDATLRTFTDLLVKTQRLKEFRRSDMTAVLANGAEVIFRSADDPDRTMRGPNLSGAWLDEASFMDKMAVDLTIASLREAGEQGWLTATFTPQGRQHWTHDFFNTGRPNTILFRSRTRDNIFNPVGFEDQLRQQYTSAFAEQELAGQFVDLAGTVCKREWIKVLEAAPKCNRLVRGWDFASIPESADGKGDYTAGALLGLYDGGWVVLDMVRRKVAGGQVASLVKAVAAQDGKAVEIIVEQEPGSSGKIATAYFVKELAGYNIHPVTVSRDKMTRAMPVFAQSEAGNVAIVRGAWNSDFLDELTSFPSGLHDDMVDAFAHAFNALSSPNYIGFSMA